MRSSAGRRPTPCLKMARRNARGKNVTKINRDDAPLLPASGERCHSCDCVRRLTLDFSIAGKAPDDAPYLYSANKQFTLGRALTGAVGNPDARDLPRSQPIDPAKPEYPNSTRRAIIGDPRNDENVGTLRFAHP